MEDVKSVILVYIKTLFSNHLKSLMHFRNLGQQPEAEPQTAPVVKQLKSLFEMVTEKLDLPKKELEKNEENID